MQGRTLSKSLTKKRTLNYTSPVLSPPTDSRWSSKNREKIDDSEQKQFPLDYKYREIYLNLERKVYRSLFQANNPTMIDSWEIDLQIALRILFEEPLSCGLSNFDLMKKVISNSDRVIEWFNSLPELEYRIKVCDYIIQIYNWAEKLHQWRSKKAI